MRNILQLILALSLLTILTISCSQSYSFQAFSYPPESKPHETNWEYFGKIISLDPRGKSPVEKGKRKVEIVIIDKAQNKILKDKLELECASLRSKIQWSKFEEITIKIYEVGNQYAEDDYNKKLIKNGPNLLITLSYFWDGKQFKLIKTTQNQSFKTDSLKLAA
jgi:hypothetical protein